MGKKKIGRNDPCWCGSGIKYKKCHEDRESQDSIPREEFYKFNKSFHARKECLHPEALIDRCNKIIASHTISKSNSLKTISNDGHVLTFFGTLGDLIKNGGEVKEKRIGVNTASTYYGFCEKHDAIFNEIDRSVLITTNRTLFLYLFRSVCKEFYAKKSAIESINFIRKADKGMDLFTQLRIQKIANIQKMAQGQGLDVISSYYKELCKIFCENRFEEIDGFSIRFKSMLPIVVSGAYFPEYDYYGKRINDLRVVKGWSILSVNLSNDEHGGVATFSWFKRHSEINEFMNQLISNENDIFNKIIVLVFEHFENHYFNEIFWNSLSNESQAKIRNRFKKSMSPGVERDSSCLIDNHKYVDGIQYEIAKIEPNRRCS
jgi:hypothetical protein